MNGDTVSFEVEHLTITPSVSSVGFAYVTEYMEDNGTGSLIVDVDGFKSYITYNIKGGSIIYTIAPSSVMASGDFHPIQITATC